MGRISIRMSPESLSFLINLFIAGLSILILYRHKKKVTELLGYTFFYIFVLMISIYIVLEIGIHIREMDT